MRRISIRPSHAMHGLALAVITLACVACGAASTDALSGSNQSITGTWQSTDALPGYTVILHLQQSGTTVTGTGSTTESPPAVLSVTGTFQAPAVQLTLQVLQEGQVNQHGATLTLGATLNVSPFAGVPLMLNDTPSKL